MEFATVGAPPLDTDEGSGESERVCSLGVMSISATGFNVIPRRPEPRSRRLGGLGRSRWPRAEANLLARAIGIVLAAAAIVTPPCAQATVGNFDLFIPDRFDFHTWVWTLTPCLAPADGCVHVLAIARPNAKAYNYTGEAHLVDGRYTLTVDDPFGLRCGNVYYGPTSMTHDVYSWDATTFAGSLVSSFDTGCDGVPGTLTYTFALTRS